jgi:hypothetical protein
LQELRLRLDLPVKTLPVPMQGRKDLALVIERACDHHADPDLAQQLKTEHLGKPLSDQPFFASSAS